MRKRMRRDQKAVEKFDAPVQLPAAARSAGREVDFGRRERRQRRRRLPTPAVHGASSTNCSLYSPTPRDASKESKKMKKKEVLPSVSEKINISFL